MNPFKPSTWFSKSPAIPMVYVAADPSHPHVGLSTFSENKIDGPSLCVVGITLTEARLNLCGKVIDWAKLTPQRAGEIKSGGKVTLTLDAFKNLFK